MWVPAETEGPVAQLFQQLLTPLLVQPPAAKKAAPAGPSVVSSLHEVPSGHVGKLLVFKSGKVRGSCSRRNS